MVFLALTFFSFGVYFNDGSKVLTETEKEEAILMTYYAQKWQIEPSFSYSLQLFQEVGSWLGTPYKYAACTKSGTDCSGFVQAVFQKVYNINLPRISRDMAAKSQKISKANLQHGDLVFFKTSSKPRINHVGIYLGDGKFAHSSTKKGVIISTLNEGYYLKTFVQGGRV